MNGRYTLAETATERLAIAVIAAFHAYELENPQGVRPGYSFLESYLEPFVEREVLEVKLGMWHRAQHAMGPQEIELAKDLMNKRKECEEIVHGGNNERSSRKV